MIDLNAVSIEDCSHLDYSFEDALKKTDFRKPITPTRPTNFVKEALRGLSKSFISSELNNEVRLSKNAKSILAGSGEQGSDDDSATINFLTPLTIDKLFLDRLLTDGPEKEKHQIINPCNNDRHKFHPIKRDGKF